MADKQRFSFRLASPEDAGAIYEIYGISFPHHQGQNTIEYSLADFEYLLQQKTNYSAAIAFYGSKPIGFAQIYDMVLWGYLDLIAVLPEFRRRYVAKDMILLLERNAPLSWRVIECCYDPENEGSVNLLTSVGYRSNFLTGIPYRWKHKSVRRSLPSQF